MPAMCVICNQRISFNSYKICSFCTSSASSNVFDKAMSKAEEYQPVIPPEPEWQQKKKNRSGFPTPVGPASSINTPMVELMAATDSGGFDNWNEKQCDPIIDELLEKYLTAGDFFVSPEEAATKKDHIVTYKTNSNRIDRQGPASGYKVMHAVYAIQLGKMTLAGIHMESNRQFSGTHLVEAFRLSIKKGVYIRVYYGEKS